MSYRFALRTGPGAHISFSATALLLLAPACSPAGGDSPSSGGAASGSAGAAGASAGSSQAGSGGANSVAGTGGSAGTPAVGGQGNTAGSAGSGGSGGSSVAGGGSGGSGGSGDGALVFDDFEGVAVGAPDPTKWQVYTGDSPSSPEGTVSVVDSDVRPGGSGAHAVKVVVTGGHSMLMNVTAFPPPAGVVHFRAWVKFEQTSWSNHVTFVESGGTQSEEVRLGGQNGFFHANLTNGDGLSPNPFTQPCPLCTAPTAGAWECIAGMFDTTTNVVQAWLGTKQIVNAQSVADWHNSTAPVLPASLTRIGFGWEAYGSIPNTVYYDDISIGYTPLPCP